MSTAPWKVSLHGGHSSDYCDHADSSLRDMLEAAVAAGYHTFGVSEHAPRVEERFLYPNEVALGWDVPKIISDFERYAQTLPSLMEEFADRLIVLRGFESEVVPTKSYVALMQEYRRKYGFEYVVGSVHYVDEISIDGSLEDYQRAIECCGGLEALAVRYYEKVAEMVQALQTEVIGHLDVIRKNAAPFGSVETPRVRRAAEQTLEAIRANGAIVEVSTAGYRKGLHSPYPAPWLVQAAKRMGIGFCLGDDSHSAQHVGFRLEQARDYLLQLGVRTLKVLTRDEGVMCQKVVSLDQ